MGSKPFKGKAKSLPVGCHGFFDSFYLHVGPDNKMYVQSDAHLSADAFGHELKVTHTPAGLVVDCIEPLQKIHEPIGERKANDLPIVQLTAGNKAYKRFNNALTYLDLGYQPIDKVVWLPQGTLKLNPHTGEVTGTKPTKGFAIQVFDKPTKGCLEVRRGSFCFQAKIDGKWYPLRLDKR